MVHRDIKPSNLMLTVGRSLRERKKRSRSERPTVKILDMGLALLSDAHSPDNEGLTTTGQMMGTLDYMAPEQGGDSKNVDIRADIYALGASLYRLLCGQVIYHGEKYSTPVQKMMALAVTPAPPIQQRIEGIPDQLAAIVHRMLEKEPDARFTTPQEVADALEPFCAGADLSWLLSDDGERPAPDSALSATDLFASSSEVDTDVDPSAVTIAPAIDTKGATAGLPSSARAKAKARPQIPTKLLIAGGAGLLGIVGLLAAMVFFFQTPNGTLRLEITDPEIEVKVKGHDIVLTNADDKQPIKLKAGEHTLIVTRGDFTFETKDFILKKGETTTVKVELLPGKVQVVSAGNVLGEQALDNGPSSPTEGYTGFALQFTGKPSRVGVGSLKIPSGVKGFTVEGFVTYDELDPKARPSVFGFPYEFMIEHGSGFAVGGRQPGGTFAVGTKTAAETHKRYHIAVVRDGKQIRLYVDGAKVGEGALKDGLKPGEKSFNIGFGAHAVMDEIRVSTTARYDADFTPADRHRPDQHTLALYHFDAGQGDVLKDSSGNNHHGKIVGAKWVRVDDGSVDVGQYALAPNGDSSDPHVTAPIPLNVDEDFCVEGWVLPTQKQHTGGQLAIFPEVAELIVDYQFTLLAIKGGRRAQLYFRQDPVAGRAHVAFVHRDQTAYVYLNGKKLYQHKFTPQSPKVVLDSMVIGNRGITIDEFRVSQHARYEADFTPQARFDADEHTLALYHYDEGQGEVLKDSSGNEHHGKIVGGEVGACERRACASGEQIGVRVRWC